MVTKRCDYLFRVEIFLNLYSIWWFLDAKRMETYQSTLHILLVAHLFKRCIKINWIVLYGGMLSHSPVFNFTTKAIGAKARFR
jgi:hypothetical protein